MAARLAALLGLLLLCLGGCAAATETPVPAARAAPSARGARGATTPTAWTGEDAIAALRRRLAGRGLPREVTAGPMVALWEEDAPPSRLRAEPAVPSIARRGGPGAWLVVTEAGGWWVWETDDLGPVPLSGLLLD